MGNKNFDVFVATLPKPLDSQFDAATREHVLAGMTTTQYRATYFYYVIKMISKYTPTDFISIIHTQRKSSVICTRRHSIKFNAIVSKGATIDTYIHTYFIHTLYIHTYIYISISVGATCGSWVSYLPQPPYNNQN